jgi:integrase
VSTESPTLGLSHLQVEAMLTTARHSTNSCDFALVCMLGLLGLRIFEATGASFADLGEEHGHRVLRVHGNGDKTVLVPLPPAVAGAIDRAVGDRTTGPILLNTHSTRAGRYSPAPRDSLRSIDVIYSQDGRAPPGSPHSCAGTSTSTATATTRFTCPTCAAAAARWATRHPRRRGLTPVTEPQPVADIRCYVLVRGAARRIAQAPPPGGGGACAR